MHITRDVQRGVRPEHPLSSKILETPLSGEAGPPPPPIAALSATKIFRFF